MARVLRRTVPGRRGEQRLLSPARQLDLRALARPNPRRLRTRGQGEPLSNPHPAAARTRWPGGAVAGARPSSRPEAWTGAPAAARQLPGRAGRSRRHAGPVPLRRPRGVRAPPRVVVLRRGGGHPRSAEGGLLFERHTRTPRAVVADG